MLRGDVGSPSSVDQTPPQIFSSENIENCKNETIKLVDKLVL